MSQQFLQWPQFIVIITAAQLHLTNFEPNIPLRSNPIGGMSGFAIVRTSDPCENKGREYFGCWCDCISLAVLFAYLRDGFRFFIMSCY